VSKPWVIDASPLIFLVKISQIHLLTHLCDIMVIPDGVAQEVRAGAADDPMKHWLQREGTPWIKDVKPVEPVIAAWDLGIGESEVLSWCYRHPGYEAIIDDGTARKCALAMGIPVRGTLGILLLAKKEGHISRIAPIFNELIRLGFRINPKVLDTALDWAGERLV
jgi:predicted nucleic acid-binding protein